MKAWLGHILDRIFAVVGALLFAQFPSFFSQYLHQLSGHVAELNYQIYALEQSAKGSGKTLTELIAKFKANIDPDIVFQGNFLQNMLDRFSFLNEAFIALQGATLLSKPFLFLRYYSHAIFSDTAKQYLWSVSLSLEGFLYAFIGLVAGFYAYRGVALLIKKITRPAKAPVS